MPPRRPRAGQGRREGRRTPHHRAATSIIAVGGPRRAASRSSSTDAQKRDYLVGYLVDLKLGARAAREAKIDDNPDFERSVAYFRDKLLLDDYLGAEAKKAVTPEAMQKLYDESVKGMHARGGGPRPPHPRRERGRGQEGHRGPA